MVQKSLDCTRSNSLSTWLLYVDERLSAGVHIVRHHCFPNNYSLDAVRAHDVVSRTAGPHWKFLEARVSIGIAAMILESNSCAPMVD